MWVTYDGLADEAVAGTEVPTLVLAADRDELVGLDLAIALYRALINAEFAVSLRRTTARRSRRSAPRCSLA
jgi:predicted esterase